MMVRVDRAFIRRIKKLLRDRGVVTPDAMSVYVIL